MGFLHMELFAPVIFNAWVFPRPGRRAKVYFCVLLVLYSISLHLGHTVKPWPTPRSKIWQTNPDMPTVY